MTRKGCSKMLQPGVTPARGTCCNPRANPRRRHVQGSQSKQCLWPKGEHCQDSIRAASRRKEWDRSPLELRELAQTSPALGISSIPSSPQPMPKKEILNSSETRVAAQLRGPEMLPQPAFRPCLRSTAAQQLLGN